MHCQLHREAGLAGLLFHNSGGLEVILILPVVVFGTPSVVTMVVAALLLWRGEFKASSILYFVSAGLGLPLAAIWLLSTFALVFPLIAAVLFTGIPATIAFKLLRQSKEACGS